SRERVWITTPYFVPDRALAVALETAALRGIDVRLLVPRLSNHPLALHAGRSFYDQLLRSGVHMHEYLPGMLHTKTIVVDGEFATVGSANLDVRSFRLNFELTAVLWDEACVGRLEQLFREDLANSEEVSLETWRQRGVIQRFSEGVGRLFA